MAGTKVVERYSVGTAESSGALQARPSAKRWPYLGPLMVFAIIAVFLGVGLRLNPREIPSPLSVGVSGPRGVGAATTA